MATNTHGGTRRNSSGSSNSSSKARTGNSSRRTQDGGMIKTARDNKLATAAAVGGAVAAGAFLWSRRNQISEQIGKLAQPINEEPGEAFVADSGFSDGRSQQEIAEEALTLKEIGAAS